MQYALIRDFLVRNIIEADETFAARIEPEWQAVEPMQPAQDADLAVAIGWGWAPGEPAPAPEPPAEGELPTPRRPRRVCLARSLRPNPCRNLNPRPSCATSRSLPSSAGLPTPRPSPSTSQALAPRRRRQACAGT